MKRRIFCIVMIFAVAFMCACTGDSGQNEEKEQTAEKETQTDTINSAAVEDTGEDVKLEGPYSVIRIVDGDTIVLEIEGTEEKVRLIGVDTPESVHPDESRNVAYGKIATQFTKKKLENKDVYIEYDVSPRDKYGRILAYVYVDGEMYNKMLLKEGHAQIATYPPNVKYTDIFTELQKEARAAGKGLWGYTETETEENTESSQASGKYIGTSRSKKFHRTACQWAKKISQANAVYFSNRNDAVNAGYVPCKVCNP